jgi:hypothetical protein
LFRRHAARKNAPERGRSEGENRKPPTITWVKGNFDAKGPAAGMLIAKPLFEHEMHLLFR